MVICRKGYQQHDNKGFFPHYGCLFHNSKTLYKKNASGTIFPDRSVITFGASKKYIWFCNTSHVDAVVNYSLDKNAIDLRIMEEILFVFKKLKHFPIQ